MTQSTTKPRRGRPPKNPRGSDDTRALLIRSGVELLTEQGFVASGLDQILKTVGVPKGSFYHYFASKEAFGLAVLDAYDDYFAAKLDRHLLDNTIPPLTRLRGFVDDARQGMARHDYKRGCLVGNLGQEITQLPNSFGPRILEIFRHWEQKVAACLEEAQSTADIDPQADAAALAEAFWIGWEGAVSRARLVQSSQPLDRFFEQFLSSLTLSIRSTSQANT